MIVPMKKVSLLVMDKSREDSLEQIRELGMVHLEKKTVTSPALTKLLDRRTQLEIALGVLTTFTPKKKKTKTEPLKFDGDLAHYVVALSDRRKKLQDYMFNHQREMDRFEKWGEFDPKDFAYLAKNGVHAYLYEISPGSYQTNTADAPVLVLSRDKKNNVIRLLAFEAIPNEQPWPLPERSLSAVVERNRVRKEELVRIEAELVSLSPLKKQIENERAANLADIEFETARAGMELIDENADGEDAANLAVSWISGYVPAADMGMLKRAAGENGWAFCADDPAEDDMDVPTKLKNNSVVKLLTPLTDFLEVVPGYREADISGWFLLFFTIYFGMIFGDAAYGAIFLIAALIGFCKTIKKGVPPILKLVFLLGLSNFIWGVATCTWLGVEVKNLPLILQQISLPLISNLTAAQSATGEALVRQNLMIFCFSLALVQLSIGHIVAMTKCRGPKLLGELGSMAMLAGMYGIVLILIASNEYRNLADYIPMMPCVYILGAGFVLNFVFVNYDGSIGRSVVESLKNFISMILGIANVFSDIMSYIRLWAVGLAGAAISSTVVTLAGPMLGHFILFILGVILLVFGHSLNLVLNALSVLVHAVRLNTLEFSGHVGLTWMGIAYKPFAKRAVKK